MKFVVIITFLAIGLFSITSCTPKSQTTSAMNEKNVTVTGTIAAIEYGKDGYMATIQDADGKTYLATISVVNMQKSGGHYQSHQPGDKIKVTGPTWNDDNGTIHITVHQMESLK